jgi:signal transduction histidine kinase
MLASFGFNIPHLVYFFIGIVTAFTICILMYSKRSVAVDAWTISNIVGVVGIVGFAYGGVGSALTYELGAALTVVSGALKALAFADNHVTLKRYQRANVVAFLSLVCAALLLILPVTPYLRMLFLIGLALTLIASLMYVNTNRQWRGLRQAAYARVALALGVVAIIVVMTKAFPLGAEQRLVNLSAQGVVNFAGLCVASISIQLVFLMVTLARDRRNEERALRRNMRLKDNLVMKQRLLQETLVLSDERQNLIKMLTHEVRQPLNTAQAALQSIAADVVNFDLKGSGVRAKLDDALAVLNAITVSISNSLLGATLISNSRQAELKSVDICDVSQLAYLDINLSDRHRINVQFEQTHIYVDADPIVLRLAIRNLLENAVKYSPSNTPIVFKVGTEEGSLSAQFYVTNQIIDKAMLDGDLFARNKRGADRRYGGDGLGLFIVNEVAKMHEGSLRFDIAGNEVTFCLEIPA